MQYFLSVGDVEEFNRTHEISEKISVIWEDFLSKIGKVLREEAISKGLSKIEYHPVDKLLNRNYSRSMMFWIEDASTELKLQLLNYEYLIIVLLKKEND